MGYPRVKELTIDLVKYGNESKPVKLAAIKALSAGTGDGSVQSFLEDMMKYERDPNSAPPPSKRPRRTRPT